MYPICTNISLDSTNDSVNSTRTHLKVIFDRPILIPDDGKTHFLKMERGKFPMVVYNISSALGNNTIRYSVNDGGAYSTITFSDGIWEVGDIYSYIRRQLELNGHYELHATTNEKEYAFNLEINEATSKGYLWIDTNYSGYGNVIVDLSNNSTSTFYLLYGFAVGQVVLDGGSATDITSTNNVNIYDSQFSIICPQILGNSSGRLSNTLYLGNMDGTRNGYKFFSSQENIIGYFPSSTRYLYGLEVMFVDRNNALLAMSDSSTDANITLSFNIY